MSEAAISHDGNILHVLFRIRQLTRGVSQYSRSLVKDWGITVPQLLCLRAISEHPAAPSPGSVARAVGVNGSTVTGILDRLEKRGLIRRERSSTDRRVVSLVLTDSGRDFLGRAPVPLHERFVERLNRLPQEDVEGLMGSLDMLVRLLEVEDQEAHPILDEAEMI